MISVIIPVYNREKTIIRAINSVIAQTYNDWELIIVDDRSTDGTADRVREVIKNDDRIRLLTNTHTKGPSGARNSGIMVAKGEYIAFLDSDDEWLPIHLEEAVDAINEKGSLFISALWSVDKWGKQYVVGSGGWYDYIFDKMKDDIGISRENHYWEFEQNLLEYTFLTDFYCFHINTIVVQRKLAIQVGIFDEKMLASEDLDFVYRLLAKTKLLTINSCHFIYHYGNDNIYAFIDRSTIDMNSILNDEKSVKRLGFNLYYKIELNRHMLKMVDNLEFSISKTEMRELLRKRLYNRIRTYACLYCKQSFIKSVLILIKSIPMYIKYNDGNESMLKPYSKFRIQKMELD